MPQKVEYDNLFFYEPLPIGIILLDEAAMNHNKDERILYKRKQVFSQPTSENYFQLYAFSLSHETKDESHCPL